jgi:diguanylate cyclase (GGDEF)-like protein
MFPNLKKSIALRLLQAVFGCYLIVTVVVTCVQLYLEYNDIKKDLFSEIFNVARSFEGGLGAGLWAFDTEAVQAILAGMGKIDIIEGVKVVKLNERTEASIGIFADENTPINEQYQVIFRNKDIKKITIIKNAENITLYQYKHPILALKEGETLPEQVGYCYIYSSQDTVLGRVKNSFIIIFSNALIKTFALWFIFLFFSQKLVSKPLNVLTKATENICRIKNSTDTLLNIANAKHKDEIQVLSVSFLSMQASIREKINNLHSLNELSIALIKFKEKHQIYQQLTYLLQQQLGIQWTAVFDTDECLCWTSLPKNQEESFSPRVQEDFHDETIFKIKSKRTIVYSNTSNSNDDNECIHLTSRGPLLYLPFQISLSNGQPQEMWLFGKIHPQILNDSNCLNEETLHFLQMIGGMAGGTINSLCQREVINEQNSSLERKVLTRTQELADVNKELMHMSVHDPLTQLPNRTLFQNRLDHEIDISIRDNKQFAVGCIDLTKFKYINDTYGHFTGDKVLVEVAQRLRSTLRNSDTVARIGGDEFALILTGKNIKNVVTSAVQRLINALDDAIILDDKISILAGANIGIAFFPEHATVSNLLYQYADIAMYQAKRTNTASSIFDAHSHFQEKNQIQFLHELEQAIENDQLLLHYQPIVDLKTNKPIALEALVRWQHPVKGLVPPNEFILHAERTALIEPLTYWVVNAAAKQCAALHKKGFKLIISVNLSRRLFSLTNLPKDLKSILDRHDLSPKYLKLEITETCIMTNPEQAMEIIKKLNETGFTLSIDDFGTGHSSLSHLTLLPVNELKIDRSFILDQNERNLVVVQTIINLGHALNLYIVAEGVEDNETLTMLREKGCDSVQGHYLCRPKNTEMIETWLDATFDNE